MSTLRGLLNLGRRFVTPETEKVLRERLDQEVTRISQRALGIAGALLMKAPRLEPGGGFEVRPVDDGWMIFELGSTLPVKLCARRVDAVKEARVMAKAAGEVKVRVVKRVVKRVAKH